MSPALKSALAMGAVGTQDVNAMLGIVEMTAVPKRLADLNVTSMEFVIIMNVCATQDTMGLIARVLLVVLTTALLQLMGNARILLSVFVIQDIPGKTAH